jgi:hypothetical protein
MACNSIKSFSYDACVSNLGGVKNVWLANYQDGAAQIAEGGETITGFTGEIEWIHFPMRKNVASMTSTLNVSEGSNYFSTELSMVFNRMETQKRTAVMALVLGEAMGIVEDANGKLFFLGKDAPLTATAGAGETGTARTDRNAYTVTLTDESAELPFEISSALKPEITPAQ